MIEVVGGEVGINGSLAEQRYTDFPLRGCSASLCDGESRYTTGTLATDYQYTGQRSQMDAVGLYYYNARWYDPALGRFAQADTLVPQPGNAHEKLRLTLRAGMVKSCNPPR